MFFCLQEVLFSLVLQFGRDSNRRVKSKLTVWYIEKETSEHFNLLIKVFKWIVLPVSLLYVFIAFSFLGVNPIDSVFVGLLIFIYSNFLPDLPAVFCKQKTMERSDSLPWYKKYALLLFAPLIVWLVVSHIPIKWKTTETFHNFKSLTIYAMFLTLFGFLVFGDLPISIGDLIESLFLSLYGIIGYVTHLRVDKIW
jgi:hypothetical protein